MQRIDSYVKYSTTRVPAILFFVFFSRIIPIFSEPTSDYSVLYRLDAQQCNLFIRLVTGVIEFIYAFSRSRETHASFYPAKDNDFSHSAV
jgi:hypothetical protein